jgi:hypothetical protein
MFAHYHVKRLPAEVLVDAIHQVTGTGLGDGGKYDSREAPPGTRAIAYPLSRPGNSVRYPFRIFGRPMRAAMCDCERDPQPSLPQALYLLNDAEMLLRIRLPKGRLAGLLASGQGDAELVGELYLWTLGRAPTEREARETASHLAGWLQPAGGTVSDPQARRREAFEDLLWALMNLKEFTTNH